jgi:anti-anti-sigma factor
MEGRGPPLGVGDDPYRAGRVALAPGSLVLLYSDGMIERDRDLERGMRDLAALVGEGPADPRALLARLVERVGPDPADDCALLALLLTGARPPLRLELAAEATALREARERIRGWLDAEGLGQAEAADVVLAASEALANSAEHAYPHGEPPSRALMSVEVARDSGDALTIVVRDRGRWKPPGDAAHRGRGLPLIRALMESVEVSSGDHGTVVRMRRRVGRSAEPAPPAPPNAGPALDVRREERPGATVVRMEGELDDVAAPTLARRVAAVDRGDGPLALDLGAVRYLGSAGVRALVELAEGLAALGRRVEIAAPPGTIARRVIDLSGVGDALGVVDAAP